MFSVLVLFKVELDFRFFDFELGVLILRVIFSIWRGVIRIRL